MLVGHANILMLYLVHPLSPLMGHVTLLLTDTVQVRGTKVIDTLTQEDFHKLLERYNKCIAVGGDNFEGD